MLDQGFFDHKDPQGRGPPRPRGAREHTTLGRRRREHRRRLRERASTCARWNRAHLANMLKRGYTHIGAGYAQGPRGYGRYYVQVFGTLRR